MVDRSSGPCIKRADDIANMGHLASICKSRKTDMNDSDFTIEFDDAEFRAFISRKLSQMENLQPFYVNVGEHMLNTASDRFETETAPDGTPWAALKPSTIQQRVRDGHNPLGILRASGGLRGTLSKRATGEYAQVGFNQQTESGEPLAAIHHFGADAGRNQSAKIPARPVLGMSPQDEIAISEMAEEFLRS
jgi:phage virion morphogenesis protein